MLLAEISNFEKNNSKFKKKYQCLGIIFQNLTKISIFFLSELKIVKDVFNLILNY